MKRACFAILVASTALAPATLVAQTSTQTAPAQQTTQQASQQNQAQPVTAGSISNQTIYNQSGQKFGQIGKIVQDQNGQMFAVVTTLDNRQMLVPVKLDEWQTKVDINQNKMADNTQVKLPQLQSK